MWFSRASHCVPATNSWNGFIDITAVTALHSLDSRLLGASRCPPLDKEVCQAGAVRRLVAQRRRQLQQVARQLVVLRSLQHLHRLATHLWTCAY